MSPELEAGRADSEHAGEELLLLEEFWQKKVLCQARELLPDISDVLRDTDTGTSYCNARDYS